MDLVANYHDATARIVMASGMSDKMVHMHAGMAIYLIAQLVLRTRRGSMDALSAVFVMEIANEIMDRLFFGNWRWADTAGDFLATVFWPTMVFAASRYRRARWSRVHNQTRKRRDGRQRMWQGWGAATAASGRPTA
jgi:hypothetical protein